MFNKMQFLEYVKGFIELSWVKDGIWTPFHKQHNLVVYEAADIMAKAVAGQRLINGMYIAFENADVTKYTELATNDAAYYAPVVPVVDRSFVRVTALGAPIIESSGTEYEGNKVTFLGVTDGTSFYGDYPLDDSVSVMYHSALVSMLENGDQEDDKIFSCADFAIPVTKIAGSQLGVRWELTFNKPV